MLRLRFLAVLTLTLALLSLTAARLPAAEPGQKFVFIDANANRRVTGGGSSGQVRGPSGSITLQTLHGGKQEGVDLVTINNGALKIRVVPTRGMGILDVSDAQTGQRLMGWDSPVKEVVHPALVNLESRGGLGWLDGFNEALCRCGLEFAGGPGRDRFITNTGAVSEMDLTLHGKIANLPASLVEELVDEGSPSPLHLRGIVHERIFFGPKLELVSEILTLPGSRSFVIEDAIINHAASPQEFQLIYHSNFGAPLLEGGARLVASLKEVAPMNAHAAAGVNDYAVYQPPTPGFVEQVYLLKANADADGRTEVMLRNQEGTAAVLMRWSTQQLPYLTLWKNTAAVEDGYVTGIEPGTGYSYNRRIERASGRLQQLAPGETRRFRVEFEFLDNPAAVTAAAQAIGAIRPSGQTKIVSEPPRIPE